MEKAKNLDELVELIGMESVEKCFTEYMLSIIGKAKRLDDLENHKAVMSENEMLAFIDCIGRQELYDEIADSKSIARTSMKWDGYPRYIKAIRVSLVAMGYDEYWVDTEFRDAIEKKYLSELPRT